MLLPALKPTHKTVVDYYNTLHQYGQLNIHHESSVRSAFQRVLEDYAAKLRWVLEAEYKFKGPKGK